MLCFDTSVVAEFERPNPDATVISYLKQHAAEPWAIPATVLFEYLRYYSTQRTINQNHVH